MLGFDRARRWEDVGVSSYLGMEAEMRLRRWNCDGEEPTKERMNGGSKVVSRRLTCPVVCGIEDMERDNG